MRYETSMPRGEAREQRMARGRRAADAPPQLSLLSEQDLYLFNEGTHHRLADKLGAHLIEGGVLFGVWAPDAASVSVIGDFNGWDNQANPLTPRGSTGVWEGFIPGIERGHRYKFHVRARHGGYVGDKADPFAIYSEQPPLTASIVWDLAYEWGDAEWMRTRGARQTLTAPQSTYEVHLGSWMRTEDGRSLSYREIAPKLAEYATSMGFTHVELMPVMEHPFYGSWGYQSTGYFAPSSRFGTPQDFMFLVDTLHQANVGVILDWVPSHFPTDDFALGMFDGTHLFEHADVRQGIHPDWNSYIFNYGRNEVRAFLLSSAMHWLSAYHADGIRVDAVASMLYLDYSRKEGEWIPNKYGGRENLDAIEFLRRFNTAVYEEHPDVQTIAEESTAWPMVSRPTYVGGLGFGMKWDMGWMHDTLQYMSQDPIYRRYHHNDLTFRAIYQYTENFVLPLSHDEVVHGKGSLIAKMPGDDWQRFANLRLLMGNMYASPGKKLLFMGGELGQWSEWSHESSVEWHLLDHWAHAGAQRWVGDLNRVYREQAALHEGDCDPAGFEWVDASDVEASVVSFIRRAPSTERVALCVFNYTPLPRYDYLIGVPVDGRWREVLNSDASEYGGSGVGNGGMIETVDEQPHGRPAALRLTLPPLGCLFLVPEEAPS